MLYPLLWMAVSAFKPANLVLTDPSIIPTALTLENFRAGWTSGNQPFWVFFANSLIVAGGSIIGNLLSCSLTAYALARLQFRARRFYFAVVLVTVMLPMHVTVIPQYIVFSQLDLVNTYVPLVLPKFLAVDAFFVFLMVQFIRTLPRELEDAARLDGCGYFGIFRRIVLPLALPAVGTTALFTFIRTWDDFLGPLLYLNDPNKWTVTVGLNGFLDTTGVSAFGPLFAMATLSIAPIVGFFLVSQRLLIEGVATTGLK
jgi:multiple sugar transport system permease protein